MASYTYRSEQGTARIHFRFNGKQHTKVETVESERHAARLVALIEETLIDIERGKLKIPSGVDERTFILTGGKVEKRDEEETKPVALKPKPETIENVFSTYSSTLTPGSKEQNSIETEETHTRHFKRIFGPNKRFDALNVITIQRYIDKRANEGVVRDTIRKELSTLRVVWGWALKRGHLTSPLSWKMNDLTFPKSHEKPAFQTWDQISRKIERGGLSDDQKASLWECLWLDESQTMESLAWVREHARYSFINPMFAFAAFTGARRGEIIRSEIDDWDFDGMLVEIRQKKADKSRTFTRRSVPIHPELATVMQEWFRNHPGGQWTIADEDGSPICGRMATKYFRSAVRGGKWQVLHGWHTFRHSLASNMAVKGIDQRDINGILGHSTDEMERRYRHLCPRKQGDALSSLFKPRSNS